SALFSAAETSTDVTGHELIMDRSKKQVQVSGVDHAAAFASNDVRNIIEQMLLIALGCVSAPGDFPPPGQTVADSSNGGSQSTDSSTADSSGQVASNDSGNTDSGNPPDPSDWSTDSQATT
ncbi:MAG: hypothetical protein ABSC93_29170, partial [Bryobacteraceae bacterium]